MSEHGPVIKWMHNDGTSADPPANQQEWEQTVRSVVKPMARVLLVSREDGRWWVSSSSDQLPPPGPGTAPIEINPTPLREPVTAALKAKGLPVAD